MSRTPPPPPAALTDVRLGRRRVAAAPTPALTPAPTLAPVFTPRSVAAPAPEVVARTAPVPSAAAAPVEADLLRYWSERRGARAYPALSELDPARLGACMLLRCEGAAVRPARAPRQRFAADADGVDCTPMVTEWLLGLGAEAARLGRPLEDREIFPSWMGVELAYRAVALPLGDGAGVDHVLCIVEELAGRR